MNYKTKACRTSLPFGGLFGMLLVAVLLLNPDRAEGQTPDPWTAEGAAQLKVSWLSDEENLLVVELNKARTDPARYAREYIEPELALFLPDDPLVQQKPNGALYTTLEGASAIKECIGVMKSTLPMKVLVASEGMSKAARDHVRDMDRRVFVAHKGSDGSDPYERMNRYGKWGGFAAENISAGIATAREIVMQLLVDDGVASRGHRDNILDPALKRVGVALAPHEEWGWSATMDFASEYTEK
ncbi:MAG: CAP domain-containing protein [Bacteroidales bacterium]|nr:CAP domain-containing protein [Bacteroidales bacterium]MDD3665188.1 CAP domain-containing protein [Bacteroidales bacterium]